MSRYRQHYDPRERLTPAQLNLDAGLFCAVLWLAMLAAAALIFYD